MAYCTVNEVIEMIKEDALNTIIGNDYIEDENEKTEKLTPIVESSISDADAEIDGYLMKRYSMPFISVPKVLNKFSKDISIYNLFSRAGIDEGERESNYLTRYKVAIKFLENVAKGIIDIGATGDNDKKVSTDFKLKSSDRLFSRNSMRGM